MENGSVAYVHKNHAHGDDAHLIRQLGPDMVLDAVLDGVSTGNGKIASQLTVEKLEKGRITKPEDIGTLLQEANYEVYRKTNGRSGTTAAVALKINDQLYLFNAGDSPAYLIRGGRIEELTTMDRDTVDLAVVTNCIGDGRRFRYHTHHIGLQPHDRLVLVTDGVSDNIDPREIKKIVMNEDTPQNAVDKLWGLLVEKRLSKRGRPEFFDYFRGFKFDDATAIIRYI